MMNPEHAHTAAEVITAMWEGEFAATCQVLAAVKDDNRHYRPDPKSRSAWELATHIATADIWFIDSIINGAFVWDAEGALEGDGEEAAEREQIVAEREPVHGSLGDSEGGNRGGTDAARGTIPNATTRV